MQLNFIANAPQVSSSGLTIAVVDPSDGLAFDQIQRSNATDRVLIAEAARDIRLRQACKRRRVERLNIAPQDVELALFVPIPALARVVPVTLKDVLDATVPSLEIAVIGRDVLQPLVSGCHVNRPL